MVSEEPTIAESASDRLPICPLGHIGCRRAHKAIVSDSGEVGLCAPLPPPDVEARSLLKLVGRNGDTLETIRPDGQGSPRELIAVPLKVEAALQAYVQVYPEEQRGIEKILKFRKRVTEEFQKLVAGNAVGDVSHEG